MPLTVKHEFESAKSDGADATLLQPSYWNSDHVMTVPSTSLVGNTRITEGNAEPVSVGAGLTMASGEIKNLSAAAPLLVSATNANVPSGRVPTDTLTITWDFATPLQARANVPDDAITLAKLENGTQGDILYYGAAGAPARLSAGANGAVLKAGGAAANPAWSYSGSPHAVLQDQKAGGTDGGSFNNGAYRDRVLNTEVYDLYNFVTLASNVFTLPAGTWVIEWSAPAWAVDFHQTRLWNDTDSAAAGQGTSEYAPHDAPNIQSRSHGIAKVVIAAPKGFTIQHRCQSSSATFGFGLSVSFGGEIYTTVSIWRVA